MKQVRLPPSEVGLLTAIRDVLIANIRRTLNQRGLKQKDLAERLGTTEAVVSKWLNQVSAPELDTIGEIATALGIKYRDLFLDPTEPIKTPPAPTYDDAVRVIANSAGYSLKKLPKK